MSVQQSDEPRAIPLLTVPHHAGRWEEQFIWLRLIDIRRETRIDWRTTLVARQPKGYVPAARGDGMTNDANLRGDTRPDEPAFSASLEARAREVVAQTEGREPDDLASPLAKEIALLIDHLDRLRGLEERLSRSLLRAECYVDTELMQMESRTPKYSPDRFPEREKLQRRLGELERERRQLAESQEKERQRLHDRLLDAVKRHEVLGDDR